MTIVIVNFKTSIKHKKWHISTSNIELGFKLTEFHMFWWICVSAGVYQEKEARYQERRAKKHIPPRNQVEKDLEDIGRWPAEGGPTWHWASWPRGPPVSLGLLRWFLHRLTVCIFAVDQGRFDPRVLVYPTGLYKQALPLPWRGEPLIQGVRRSRGSLFHQRIRLIIQSFSIG
jgi:hypothetical protein